MSAKKLERSAAELFLEQALRAGRATQQELSLKAVKLDDRLQSRVGTMTSHVQHLASLLDLGLELRGIVAFRDPAKANPALLVADGFHRVKAYRSKGRTSIPGFVIDGTESDAILYSVSANLANSQPTGKEDRRKAVEMMLADAEFFTWGDGEIGRRCGVGITTTAKYRREYCSRLGIPLPTQVKIFGDGALIRVSPYGPLAIRGEGPASTRVLGKPRGKYYRVRIKGRDYHLGKDREAAEAKLAEIASRNAAVRDTDPVARVKLGQPFDAAAWLARRSVPATVIPVAISPTGGIEIGSAVAVGVDNPDFDAIVRAIGVLSLLAKVTGHSRAVVICYRDAMGGNLTRLREIAALPPNPIEFMTPEEVVAEFGPKPSTEGAV